MFSPSTKEELQDAINLWCKNEPVALEQYGNINTWDVSKITDMSGLFEGKENFNSYIGLWDVSNASVISHMFDGAELFYQDIVWNVSNATDIWRMQLGS